MASWQTVARQAAQRHGVPPAVFVAQIRQESGGRDVTSNAGAQGPAQFIPSTARAYGLNDRTVHQLAPSLDAAARYMADNLRQYGTVERALSAYNSGRPDAYKDPAFAGGQTYHYVRTILGAVGGTARTPHPAPKATTRGASSAVTTTTTPGVDNSDRRRQMIGDFLASGGVRSAQATQTLASGWAGAQDVPGTTSTKTTTTPGARPSRPRSTAATSKGTSGSKVLELIYNDGGKGYGIKDGKAVDGPSTYSAVWAGHANHVHVAAGPKTVVRLGRLAQEMGLSVGENPHFGGVDPVHVPGSYHYKAEAIDVSGDPSLMARFAKRVERYNRTRKL
jgi:hypothetical protein